MENTFDLEAKIKRLRVGGKGITEPCTIRQFKRTQGRLNHRNQTSDKKYGAFLCMVVFRHK